jgi:hypothetical protein
MLVKELMERTNMPSFGMARMLIEDGLTEMAITQESFIKEEYLSIHKGQRFYDTPREAIRITDILVKNHMNTKGEFRSIPRLLNKPKVKDIDMGYNQSLGDSTPKVSDLNGTFTSTSLNQPTRDFTGDDKAREYGYFWEGNRLAIVEKEIYNVSTGDIVNDTDAYQKSTYRWVSPQLDAGGFVRIRYTYIPTYNDRDVNMGDAYRVWVSSVIAPSDSTHQVRFTCCDLSELPVATAEDVSTNIAAGDYFSIQNMGFMAGLWECVAVSTSTISAKRPQFIYGGGDTFTSSDWTALMVGVALNEDTSIPISTLQLNTRSLYQHQEDYFLPITQYQAQALMHYIKFRMLEEVGEIDKALYFEKKFKTAIEKQKTANITGPRMVSTGPFALK